MPKYLTKILFAVFAVLALFVILAVTFNNFLYFTKNQIEEEARRNLSYQISIGKIFYAFPSRIILKNVILAQKPASPAQQPNQIFRSSQLSIQFYLWEALARLHFVIRSIELDGVGVKYREGISFLQNNTKEILRIISQFPPNDIQFQMKNVLMDVRLNEKTTDVVAMDLNLNLKGKNLRINGAISKKDGGRPLRFELQGEPGPQGILIKDMVFERYDLYGKFGGSLKSGRLQLNGFSLLDTLAKADRPPQKLSKNQRLEKIINRLKGSPDVDRHLDPNIYILDIGCRAKVAFPETDIEAFIFTVNNMPVSLKGKLSWNDPLSLKLTGSILPSQMPGKPRGVFKHADLALATVFLEDGIKADGNLRMDFQDLPNDEIPFEKINVDFKDNMLSFDSSSRLKFNIAQSKIEYWINTNAHQIEFQNATVLFNLQGNLKLVLFESPFYNGWLNGKIWVDNSRFPLRINGAFILRDVEANKLAATLDHFAKIHGKVFSQLYFTNDPDFALKGKIAIQDGEFRKFEFFNWLADNFTLDSLRDVAFKKSSADFSVDIQKSGLYDIDLMSDDVKVSGSFAVDRDKMVSSKLSLIFSRGLLATSPKFKPILVRMEDTNEFGFDFQLSGRQQAMNFQWLDSELKQNIQSWMPNFIERRIERNIDKSLQKPPEPPTQNEQPNPQ